MALGELDNWSEDESVAAENLGYSEQLTDDDPSLISLSDDESIPNSVELDDELVSNNDDVDEVNKMSPEVLVTDHSRDTHSTFDNVAFLDESYLLATDYCGPDDAYTKYCVYAKVKGFSVRKGAQRYVGRTNEVRWKEFVCSCAGIASTKVIDTRVMSYKKFLLRSDCKAKIRVSRLSPNLWHINKSEMAHNHALVPCAQAYMLRSNRNIAYGKQEVIDSMTSFGIGVNVACDFLERQCRGRKSLGFTKQDAYDHVKKSKRVMNLENGDASLVMGYFIKRAYAEKDFYWTVEQDDEGRIMHFFYRDARAVEDYKIFGEILSIDTTYRTNRYNLICAPFVGVNHHTFNIMFGMAFLSDETAETFEWLFNVFLTSMKGMEPKVIFSDRCVPMMNVIDKVFPNARHRLCQWHVSKNATKHFGHLNSNDTFKKMWYRCLNGIESEDEFESLWKTMIDTYELGEKKWFRGMYKLRKRWASVFTQGMFAAGLHATFRSEATNRVLKILQKSSHSLFEFVENFEDIQRRWRMREIEEDTLGLWVPGQVVPDNKLLSHAASVYTRYVYKLFELQFLHSNNVVLVGTEVDVGDQNLEITVSTADGAHSRKVTYNVNTNCSYCSCRMWETDGIYCRHIIRVLSVRNVFSIPDSQILKGWSRGLKGIRTSSNTDALDKRGDSKLKFMHDAIMELYDMGGVAVGNDVAEALISERVKALHEEVISMIGNENAQLKRKSRHSLSSGPYWNLICNPIPIRGKGWGLARKHRHSDATKQKGKLHISDDQATHSKGHGDTKKKKGKLHISDEQATHSKGQGDAKKKGKLHVGDEHATPLKGASKSKCLKPKSRESESSTHVKDVARDEIHISPTPEDGFNPSQSQPR